MADYKVEYSEDFELQMEEAVVWLYLHNIEQSEEFAEQKSIELRKEVEALENHLRKTPYMGQADEISGLRRFPVYNGRFVAVWVINENEQKVILVEFIDAKYPQKLREFKLEE